jgi:hypothetical protein
MRANDDNGFGTSLDSTIDPHCCYYEAGGPCVAGNKALELARSEIAKPLGRDAV